MQSALEFLKRWWLDKNIVRIRHDTFHLTRTLNIYFENDLIALGDMLIHIAFECSIMLPVNKRMFQKAILFEDLLEFLF